MREVSLRGKVFFVFSLASGERDSINDRSEQESALDVLVGCLKGLLSSVRRAGGLASVA